MGRYIAMIVIGLVLAAFGFGSLELGPSFVGFALGAVGAVLTQVGVIAAAVHLGTERLHSALGEIDDAVSVLDPDSGLDEA